MISLSDYFMGRDQTHASALTQALRSNAERTVAAANALLQKFGKSRKVNSGWRPKEINAATKGADPESPHVTCEGIDIEDHDSALKQWAIENPDDVVSCGFVAMENPAITPGWAHFQTRPSLPWQKGRNILLAAEGWRNKSGEAVLA